MKAPAFDPIFPKTDRETQRFAEDITALLNRVHRNEFTYSMPCEDALAVVGIYFAQPPDIVTGGSEARLTRLGWGPAIDGYYLKRVRIQGAFDVIRTFNGPSIKVRALVADKNGGVEVGSFDSSTQALSANKSRTISAGDMLDRKMPAGSVVQVETTQVGWPKLTCRNLTVHFDIGVT